MILKIFLIHSTFFAFAFAQVLSSPIDVMQAYFGTTSSIEKKNILLSTKEAQEIQTKAKVKLQSKIFRTYSAKVDGKLVGYGIMVSKMIRSKNGVVLYIISSKDDTLKAIEVIAFNEPLEYLPSPQWKAQFEEKKTDTHLHLSQEIHTITGATLSARAITDGSRLAFALYNTLLAP